MGRVDNKIALVTGAGTGIGRATAQRLSTEGATVIVTDINLENAQATASKLGDTSMALSHDVRESDDWDTVLQTIGDSYGRLDILVNNAGILAVGDSQTIEDTDLEHWRAIQQVNVEGVYLGCQKAVQMMKSHGGSIVNLSSIAGLLGTPHLFAYGASKGAVRQLTKSVATFCGRMGYGIRCNSVHPGVIQTQMGDAVFELGGGDAQAMKKARAKAIPAGHLGEPEDVANCILFLASDEARYVTAAELVVDGGYVAV